MKSTNKQRRTRHRAIVLVWTAVCGLIFIGFVGLAMDTALILSAGEQLQAISDAASLAGARLVQSDIDAARNAAVGMAYANYVFHDRLSIDRDADVIVGQFDRNTQIFDPGASGRPNAVRAIARRTGGSPGGALPLVFARAFGVTEASVSRDAIATLGGGMGSGVIVLNHTADCALRMDGGAILNVLPAAPQTCADGAGVFVNSNASGAACVNSNSTIHTTGLWIDGGFNGSTSSVSEGSCGSATGSTLIREHTGIVLPDPLGCAGGTCVPEPSTSGLADQAPTKPLPVRNGDTIVILPGWYSKGINCTGGSLTMQPGVYILGGNPSNSAGATGLSMSGGSSLCARGVMIFIKGPHGVLDLEGSGACIITPMDYSQTGSYFCNASYSYPSPLPNSQYQGLAVFQARDNLAQSKVVGGSGFDLRGTYYFPSNQLKVSGNAFNQGVQLIADTLWLTGTANISINYDGRNPSNASSRVFLVE